MLAKLKFGSVLALFCIALAVLVWFAPLPPFEGSSKIGLVTQFVNSVVSPVVDVIGKWSAIAILAMLAALGLAHSPSQRATDEGSDDAEPEANEPQEIAPEETLPEEIAPQEIAPEATQPKRSLFNRLKRREAEAVEKELPAPVRKRGFANLTSETQPEELDANDANDDKPELSTEEAAIATQREAEFQEVESLADQMAAEWERQATPHSIRIDPIAIVRKHREKDRDWSDDRSHLGGLPRLGNAEWPRDTNGVPMPFIAQLDLAEIAAANPETPLPKIGSLAFFIGDGAVIHVPEGDHPHTPAPEGLPHAVCETSYPLPEKPSLLTHPLFPFWPVEALRLRMPDDLPEMREEEDNLEIIEAVQNRALDEMVPPREYAYSPYTPRKEGLEGVDTLWWYGAELVLRQLRTALDQLPDAIAMREKWIAEAQDYQARMAAEEDDKSAEIARSKAGEERHRTQIPQIEEQGRGLAEFIHHFENFVQGREPWEEMGEQEVQVLDGVIRGVRDDFEDLCRYIVSFGIDDIRSACIRRMITGDHAAVAAIPDPLLDYINAHYRRPTGSPNLMFGLGGCKQIARYEHMCDHLLLQIPYDDMPEMRFGDMGLFQWWISPEALAAGDFSKVELTFECS